MRAPSKPAPVIAADYFPGDSIDLLRPAAGDIRFSAICLQLSRIARFCGGTQFPYCVAQHSVVVAERCSPAAQPYAVLHDAHEFIVGDQTRPFVRALDYLLYCAGHGDRAGSMAMAQITMRLDAAIWSAAGLPPPDPKLLEEIAAVDSAVCEAELALLVRAEDTPQARAMLGVNFTVESQEVACQRLMDAIAYWCPATAPEIREARQLRPKHR